MTEGHIYRQKLTLLVLDVLAFLSAFVVAMHLRFTASLPIFEFGLPPWDVMVQSLPVMLGVWLLALKTSNVYAVERHRLFFELARIVRALVVFTAVLALVVFFYRGFSYSRGFALLFITLVLAFTFAARIAFRIVRAHIEGLDEARTRLLLVGDSIVAKHLAEQSGKPGAGFTVVGLLDDTLPAGTEIAPGVAVVGRITDLVEHAKTLGAQSVLVTSSKIDQDGLLELLDLCLAANLEWKLVPSAYELMLDRATFDVVAGVPVLGTRRSNIRGANRFVKRLFDIVVASIALVLLSPLMLFVALAIKLTSKGPVLFSQDRVGENGEVFRFLKFRTMQVNNDDAIHREYAKKWIAEGKAATTEGGQQIFKIARDPRIIPIGGFLRKYSVDELPQLVNVLRGDMSLIGPRPPIPYEVEVYREWHRRRFEGPPGITGLWQVSGRNRLSFDEMVKLDIQYLENWSVRQDLKILWRTMSVVLFDRAY
ncbi:sugar transferase [Myxococcota bacterium]|nr:sugar transferase [Myxococcota bacterium]